jgi:uncharacterized protein (DUF983 family)
MKRILTLMLRALALRCPNCGGGGVFSSWFRIKTQCETCGLAFERNEGEDYFLGGMMFNIVLAELVYIGAMVIWIMITWPTPPWTIIQYIGVPFMAVVPFLFYPMSKTVWLAFDLLFRPATADELRADQTRSVGARR